MKVKLISFANKAFYKSQQILKKSALKFGVDEVIDYNDLWLKKQIDFFLENKEILSQKRGHGYWLWKPFIILDALKTMDTNDLLCYSDAGNTIISSIKPLIDLVNLYDVLFFGNSDHKNKIWTKRDCFYYMDCENETYYEGLQISAGFLLIKKTKHNIKLMEEWLKFCLKKEILTDCPNICGLSNIKGFLDHRHDQSILSILAMKYELNIFRDPTQWGNKYKMKDFRVEFEFLEDSYIENRYNNSPYPTIVNAHRKKIKLNIKDQLNYYLLRLKK